MSAGLVVDRLSAVVSKEKTPELEAQLRRMGVPIAALQSECPRRERMFHSRVMEAIVGMPAVGRELSEHAYIRSINRGTIIFAPGYAQTPRRVELIVDSGLAWVGSIVGLSDAVATLLELKKILGIVQVERYSGEAYQLREDADENRAFVATAIEFAEHARKHGACMYWVK